MSFAPAFLEAVAALSVAAGHLAELGRPEIAHRCDNAAARLQAEMDEQVEAMLGDGYDPDEP